MLTKQDLDLALEYYPAIKEKIMSIGEERRNQARKRSAANAQVVVPVSRSSYMYMWFDKEKLLWIWWYSRGFNFRYFARRTNSHIQESQENYYSNSATIEKLKFTNSKLCEKSQNQKFAKIWTCENYQTYSISLRFRGLVSSTFFTAIQTAQQTWHFKKQCWFIIGPPSATLAQH